MFAALWPQRNGAHWPINPQIAWDKGVLAVLVPHPDIGTLFHILEEGAR
jgi:hypothetical protein